jgi:hypothetical protein
VSDWSCVTTERHQLEEIAVSVCVPAGCTTGAGCESGECGLGVVNDDCMGHVDLAYRSDADDCGVGSDDVFDGTGIDQTFERPMCVVRSSGTFIFEFDNCDVGRPLRVDGENRVASTSNIHGGSADLHGESSATDYALVLAEYWSHVCAMEHARVASVNRVSPQLMALGAPADLVRRTQQAAVDDVPHAERAFGLAAHFEGVSVGPGPLSLRGVSLEAFPEQVLTDLVEEACGRIGVQ